MTFQIEPYQFIIAPSIGETGITVIPIGGKEVEWPFVCIDIVMDLPSSNKMLIYVNHAIIIIIIINLN